MPRKVILDVDPGRDDAVAIMLAALSPDIDLLGVSVTHGNRLFEVTNEFKFLQFIFPDFPTLHPGYRSSGTR